MKTFNDFLNEKKEQIKVQISIIRHPRDVKVVIRNNYEVETQLGFISNNSWGKVSGLDVDKIVDDLVDGFAELNLEFKKSGYGNEKTSNEFDFTPAISKKIESILKKILVSSSDEINVSITDAEKARNSFSEDNEREKERSKKFWKNNDDAYKEEREWASKLSKPDREKYERGYLKRNHKGPLYTGD